MTSKHQNAGNAFGIPSKSNRGFPMVEFSDANGAGAKLQCSSTIGEYHDALERPGTSFVWLGLNDADPKIMARDALSHGVVTSETTGWVPYPVPPAVSLSTCMHLNREQVEGLIGRLQQWLDTGNFE